MAINVDNDVFGHCERSVRIWCLIVQLIASYEAANDDYGKIMAQVFEVVLDSRMFEILCI